MDGRFKYSGIIKLGSECCKQLWNKLRFTQYRQKMILPLQHRKLGSQCKNYLSVRLKAKLLKQIVPVRGASHTPVKLAGL